MEHSARMLALALAFVAPLYSAATAAPAPAVATMATPAQVAMPAGSSSTSATTILTRAKAASGGAAWDHVRSLRTEASVKVGGMVGSITTLRDLRNGRWALHYKLGPIRGARGFDGKTGWRKSPNGLVATVDSPTGKVRMRNRAYRTAHGWWYPERWPADFKSLGTKQENGKTFQVLQITPRGGEPFQMWINSSTHLIARLVYASPVSFSTYWSDYRTVHGVKIPFHRKVTTGYKQVMQLKKVAVNVSAGDKKFAIPGQHMHDFSMANGGDVVTIPFKLAGGHIHIRVSVNGHPFHFILDSGSVNVLSPQAAEAVGVKVAGSLAAAGMGAKSVKMKLARIKRLELDGKVTLRNQTFYVMPLPGHLDGTLGYGIFKRFVVRIDYARQLLTLTRPKDFDPKNAGAPVPLYFYGRTPVVAGSLDGLPGHFVIDSGNAGSLNLFEPFAEANNLYVKYDATAPVVTGFAVGGMTKGRVARGGRLMIGGVAVNNPVVILDTSIHAAHARAAHAGGNLTGNIGGRILKRFTVTFDYARKVMYLKPNKYYGTPMNYDRTGLMSLKHTRHGFHVVSVMQDSPAAQAGIKVGDVIMSVDGRPISTLPDQAIKNTFRNGTPGTSIRLSVGKRAAAHEVTITLRRLIPKTGPSHRQVVSFPQSGMYLLKTEHYASARAMFESALKKDSKDLAATVGMAKVYLAQGNGKAGVKWAKKAIALAPDDVDSWLLLGWAYSVYVNDVSIFSKLSIAHKILDAFKQAVKLAPRNGEALHALIGYYIHAPGIAGGSVDKAKARIAALKNIDPVQADEAMAALALKNNDPGKAEALLREAVSLDDSGGADQQLGLLLVRQKHYAAAMAVFRDGIREAPTNSANYYQLGRAAVLSKTHVREGIDDLKQYLTMPHGWQSAGPSYKWAHYRLGMLYGINGDQTSEKLQYQAALAIDSEFDQARKALASM